MDDDGDKKAAFPFLLPTYPDAREDGSDEILEAWAEGVNEVQVTVQAAANIKQVIKWKFN